MLIVKEDKSRAEGTGQIFVELTRNRELEISNCDRLGYWCDKPHLRHFLRELKKCFTEDELREILGMKTTNKMREIKFRGKRLDGQGWAIGNYFKTPLTADFDLDPAHGVFFASDGKERHCIANENGCVFEVDPETVGQFTGLFDKNGKEICEGDVVECDKNVFDPRQEAERMRIIVVRNAGGFVIHPAKNNEVIGNEHDNPELLKAE